MSKIENFTTEMREWFEKRTQSHMNLVEKYCNKILEKFPEYSELKVRAKKHDRSKFDKPEIDPYVWITWKHKCKQEQKDIDIPDELENAMHEATEHHVLNNSHHPEFHCGKEANVINRTNRDAPSGEALDASAMPNIDIAEMCADWMAVAEERKTSPIKWAENSIGKRWKFSKHQEALIYDIINAVWNA